MISRGWLNSWFPSLYTGCYAYTLMGPLYNNLLFAKATDTASSTSSISRRAISLDSEQLFRRDAGDQVTCKSHKGETHTFSTSECIGSAPILNISSHYFKLLTHINLYYIIYSAPLAICLRRVSPRLLLGAAP
jgi:hypothetical protein